MARATKTHLTAAEARKRWGNDLQVKLPGSDGTVHAQFEADDGVWTPEFGPELELTGYRLIKRYETKQPRRRRRSR